MDQTTRVHLLFRGASEVTKLLRRGALVCDLIAAAVSLYVVLQKPQDAEAWLPLGILLFALIATALRAYSSVAHGFAQRCRKISLRAFCSGKDVDLLTVSLLDDEAPPFVEQATSGLPAKSMQEYYEPTTPPGPLRQAELYAHSAFYTWRLLRIQAWVIFAFAVIVFTGSAIFVFHLAAASQTNTDRRAVLEAVSTIILLAIGVKAFEAWWSAFSSYGEIRAIENALLKKPRGEALRDLADSYDIERAAGPNPSSFLYNRRRDALKAKWHVRRKSFVDSSVPATAPTEGDA